MESIAEEETKDEKAIEKAPDASSVLIRIVVVLKAHMIRIFRPTTFLDDLVKKTNRKKESSAR